MRYFVYLAAFLLCQPVYAEPKSEFKRTFFPFGKYLKLNDVVYQTKGSATVSRPGEFGVLTGKTGFTGYFIQNGFSHVDYLSEVEEAKGLVFEIDTKSLSKVGVTGKVSTGEAIEGLALEGSGKIDLSSNELATYKGILIQVSDWLAVESELQKLWDEGTARQYLQDPNFRVIDAVLYATGYSGSVKLAISGDAKVNSSATGSAAKIKVGVSGQVNKEYTINLGDDSTIAFSTRYLCWENGKIAKMEADVIGDKRTSTCKVY